MISTVNWKDFHRETNICSRSREASIENKTDFNDLTVQSQTQYQKLIFNDEIKESVRVLAASRVNIPRLS